MMSRDSILAPGRHGKACHRAGRRVGLLCLESAVAIAQQHRNTCVACHGDVDLSIAVKIAGHHAGRSRSSSVGLLRQEGSVSISKQYTHIVAALVDDDDVFLSVPIKIALEHKYRIRADRIGDRRRKGSISLADQDLESRAIQRSKIGLPVAVEVPCRDEVGIRLQCRP